MIRVVAIALLFFPSFAAGQTFSLEGGSVSISNSGSFSGTVTEVGVFPGFPDENYRTQISGQISPTGRISGTLQITETLNQCCTAGGGIFQIQENFSGSISGSIDPTTGQYSIRWGGPEPGSRSGTASLNMFAQPEEPIIDEDLQRTIDEFRETIRQRDEAAAQRQELRDARRDRREDQAEQRRQIDPQTREVTEGVLEQILTQLRNLGVDLMERPRAPGPGSSIVDMLKDLLLGGDAPENNTNLIFCLRRQQLDRSCNVNRDDVLNNMDDGVPPQVREMQNQNYGQPGQRRDQ